MKHSKDTLTAEKKNHKALQKSLEEDSALLQSKEAEMSKGRGAYEELKSRREATEKAVVAAQKHFQAVSAGLSSGAGGQEETLAAQKIGETGSLKGEILRYFPTPFTPTYNPICIVEKCVGVWGGGGGGIKSCPLERLDLIGVWFGGREAEEEVQGQELAA